MPSFLDDLPELLAVDARPHLIRIPDQVDVPVTPRVLRLIDTAAFRRLQGISQLGLVSQVYPAARHTRFEHSLGVYRLALDYLRRLRGDPRFQIAVTRRDVEVFLVAALCHDLGHWPFCHLVEDMGLPLVPSHEQLARRALQGKEIAECLQRDWGIAPQEVADLLEGVDDSPPRRLMGSLLSGPIDIDKLDYLQRDSLHAGVPYGRNFDPPRLIGSLCLNSAGDRLAISEKGRTAAEMLVFARYVMFSEVYWHHAVRSATTMLQRGFFRLRDYVDWERLVETDEARMRRALRAAARVAHLPGVTRLLEGLFGPRRSLFKQVLTLGPGNARDLHCLLAHRPFPWLVACAESLRLLLQKRLDHQLPEESVLVDAPPAKREVQFDVDVHFEKEGTYLPLAEVSPIVRTMAQEHFDDVVKRVRVFVAAEIRDGLPDVAELRSLLRQAAEHTPE